MPTLTTDTDKCHFCILNSAIRKSFDTKRKGSSGFRNKTYRWSIDIWQLKVKLTWVFWAAGGGMPFSLLLPLPFGGNALWLNWKESKKSGEGKVRAYGVAKDYSKGCYGSESVSRSWNSFSFRITHFTNQNQLVQQTIEQQLAKVREIWREMRWSRNGTTV